MLGNSDGNKKHTYKAVTDKDGKAIIKDVWKGIYTVDITLEGFTPVKVAKVDIKAATSSHFYTMSEILTDPFNLTINKTEDETERILTWNASTIMSDDFEVHDDFEINSPGKLGWEYIDGDEQETASMQDYYFPNSGVPMAYIVFNSSKTEPPLITEVWASHSGDKCLADFAGYYAANEDYLISPRLSFASEFKLTFWAKSCTDVYGLERMKVGYSTMGKTKDDFTNWLTSGEYEEVPKNWVEYTYTLPANTKYITIECVSDDAFAFMLDDITIEQGESKALTKYEVYLDNVKVVETTDATHTFKSLTKGKYTAGVKALYTSGSTSISTVAFEVGLDGVNKVNSTDLHIYPNPVHNILNIEGEYTSLEIYNIAGKIVMTANGQQTLDVNGLETGVYIIKAYNYSQVGTYKIIK